MTPTEVSWRGYRTTSPQAWQGSLGNWLGTQSIDLVMFQTTTSPQVMWSWTITIIRVKVECLLSLLSNNQNLPQKQQSIQAVREWPKYSAMANYNLPSCAIRCRIAIRELWIREFIFWLWRIAIFIISNLEHISRQYRWNPNKIESIVTEPMDGLGWLGS